MVPVDVAHSPRVTVNELADTVDDCKYDVSPLNDAVSVRTPRVVGVHEHVASPIEMAAVAQPVIAVPFSRNATVPDVPVAPVTAAVSVYVLAVFGEFGTELKTIEVSPQVVALVVTDGRLVAPESTGVTRMS